MRTTSLKEVPRPAWESLTPERIKTARERLGMTQAQFGHLIGVRLRRGFRPDNWRISRWERGAARVGVLYGPVVERIVSETEAQWEEGKRRAREEQIRRLARDAENH